MIYENFVMRLHSDSATDSTWELAVGANVAGALSGFVLGDVKIQHPMPKTESEDVPGTNGLYDLTESSGRVFYRNREITVPLVFRTDRTWTDTIDITLARYNGRMCDFAFAPYDDVEWIYTGRLSVTVDRFKNSVILTFDAEPFARTTEYTYITVPVSASVDKLAFGWTYDRAVGGSLTATNNSAGVIEISASDIGTVIYYKRTGLTPSDSYTLGVKSIVGGSIAFHNGADDNLTEGVVDSNGVLTIKIVVDGSYYTWQTVNNQVFSYPSFRCEYILAKMVFGESSIMLASNVVIRPEIANLTAASVLILDGAVFEIDDTNNQILQPYGAVMPGARCDKSAKMAKSIFVCVPKSTGTPATSIGFYDMEAM